MRVLVFNSFTVFLFVSLSLKVSAQSLFWQSEQVASTNSSGGITRARIALDKLGNPLILSAKGADGALFVTRYANNQFGNPLLVTPTGVETYIANWTGPDMAAHGDTVIVVFKMMPYDDGKIYTVRSTNGGVNFSDTLRVDSHPSGMVWMPSMTTDVAGNPWVTYMAHDPNYTNPRYVIARSTNGGVSYLPQQEVASAVNGEACDCCPSELAANETHSALLFRNNENNIRDIYAVVSSDGGNTFPFSRNIDEHAWFIQSCPSTGPQGVIVGDTLYTVFITSINGRFRVRLSLTNLTDVNAPIEIYSVPGPTNTNGFQNFPRMAIDNGRVFIVWTEAESSNNEIFISWAPLSDLNSLQLNKTQLNTQTTGVQTNPDVIADGERVHVVYSDSYEGKLIYKSGLIGFAGEEEHAASARQWLPNPARSGAEIPADFQKIAFILTDSYGRVAFRNDPTLGLTSLPVLCKGVYFVQWEAAQGVTRLVIE